LDLDALTKSLADLVEIQKAQIEVNWFIAERLDKILRRFEPQPTDARFKKPAWMTKSGKD
jgi:hypothetical protein